MISTVQPSHQVAGKINPSERLTNQHSREHCPKAINCQLCAKSFVNHHNLEIHLLKDHEQPKEFKCTQCDMTFMTEWRLEKHGKSHMSRFPAKTCYYFNNEQDCPFQSVGCEFRHELSRQCRYATSCRKTKCQFRHC